MVVMDMVVEEDTTMVIMDMVVEEDTPMEVEEDTPMEITIMANSIHIIIRENGTLGRKLIKRKNQKVPRR